MITRTLLSCVTSLVLFTLTTSSPVVRAAAAESLPHLLECVKAKGTMATAHNTSITIAVVGRIDCSPGNVELHVRQAIGGYWH